MSDDKPTIAQCINEVVEEYRRARTLFPSFNSLHEAYAIIHEELDEFWDIVKSKPYNLERVRSARIEMVQVAAMALATLIEFGEITE